ncbi:hypothetical protein ILUMI_09258 [Ignelater luminosus]|uniref:Uncharacterized protein n=1 Tax=Ignelater luminosus TaxID=2038154 RepID=A0A8K0D641_IGNLU|nr:hypothetical protein ILUMI_09258 [Ignelater luminosus]
MKKVSRVTPQHVADAIQTDCSKCSEKQKSLTDKILHHLMDKEPEYWKQLQAKYDPSGSYTKNYNNLPRIIATGRSADDLQKGIPRQGGVGKGPDIMPTPLNGVADLNFLQNTLPDLMDDLQLDLRTNMWFLHSGSSLHFTSNVQTDLHAQFSNKWIGRRADAPVQ